MVPSALPVLYSFRRCPYAIRARLALAQAGIAYEHREIVLRNKPEALLLASPKGTVPVLVLADGHVIEQSLDIMRWALEQSDPHDWLAPTQGNVAAMLALVERNDTQFKPVLDACKYPERHEAAVVDAARIYAEQWMAELNSLLADTGYLFGRHPCWADMALRPFVRQFARIDTATWEQLPHPHLHAWLQRWLDSALFAEVMTKYPTWEPGTPGVRLPVQDTASSLGPSAP